MDFLDCIFLTVGDICTDRYFNAFQIFVSEYKKRTKQHNNVA